jgi:hypothetical protein
VVYWSIGVNYVDSLEEFLVGVDQLHVILKFFLCQVSRAPCVIFVCESVDFGVRKEILGMSWVW